MPGDLQSVLFGEFYEKVQFRIDENQHDDLLDCLKTLYPDEPALTVAKGMKLLANALLKSKAGSKDINTFFDNNDFIKTTMYLTGKQRADIERAANRHGWTLSRECRYRIQTTLENELDFFDQELLMMNRCRNSIDKIGRNFHYIIVNDQTGFLIKMVSIKMRSVLQQKFLILRISLRITLCYVKGELFQIKWRCDYGRLR